MVRIPTVAIQHPDDPDRIMRINESRYDPEVHGDLVDPSAPPRNSDGDKSGAPSSEGDTGTGHQGGGDTGEDEGAGDGGDRDEAGDGEKEAPPKGYDIEHVAGRYWRLLTPGGAVLPGPNNGKWPGREEAIAAAREHAAQGTPSPQGTPEA